jgi:hypothetical protein
MPELTRRYIVMPMAAEGPFDTRDPEGAFVLKPWKDPAALRALETYRDHCYPELARDLEAWIATIRSGPTVRGDVGARNERYLASRPAPARAVPGAGRAAPARSRPRVKRKSTAAKRLSKKTKRRR